MFEPIVDVSNAAFPRDADVNLFGLIGLIAVLAIITMHRTDVCDREPFVERSRQASNRRDPEALAAVRRSFVLQEDNEGRQVSIDLRFGLGAKS